MSRKDGGWGWVIVTSFFFGQILLRGYGFAFGVTYIELAEKFGTSAALSSLAGSINTGASYFMGSLAMMLCARFSVRRASLVATLMLSLCIVLCSFSPNIYMFIIFYGVLSGTAASIAFTAPVVLINQYFERYRGIANGICNTGSALGILMFPPVTQALYDNYGFQGTFLLTGGLFLHNCIFSLLYRPFRGMNSDEKASEQAGKGCRISQTSFGFNSSNTIKDDMKINESNGRDLTKSDNRKSPHQKVRGEGQNRWWRNLGLHRLHDIRFCFFSLSLSLNMIAYVSFMQLIVDYGKDLGFSQVNSVLIISIAALVDVIMRPLFGILCDVPCVRHFRHILCAVIALVPWLTTLAFFFTKDFISVTIAATVVNALSGSFFSSRPILVVDLFGMSDFASSYGMAMTCIGAGVFFGPTLPAWIKDLTGGYAWAFVAIGAIGICGNSVLLGLCLHHYYVMKRKTEETVL